MKKLIITVAALAIIGGVVGALSVAAISHYAQNTKNKPAPVAVIPVAESDQKLASAEAAAVTKYQTLVTAYNSQVTECVKGKTAYDKLTNTLKNITPAPVCGQPLATPSPAE